MSENQTRKVMGTIGWKNSGKTTLVVALVRDLTKRGFRVATIKHAHHAFDIDQPGKDSYRLRKAGAQQMLIASDQRMALMTENPTPQEPRLDKLITRLDLDAVDLILVEGFKHVPFPKIELHRKALGKTLLHPDDPAIIAITCDHTIDAGSLPSLDINDTAAIATFILGWLQQQGETR